jgi:hypothetical protein
VDVAPHPSKRDLLPPQLVEAELEAGRKAKSAFKLRSPNPLEDNPDAGSEWMDAVIESEGLARVASVTNLLPGTRYRFRLIYRPRHSKLYKRGWLSWEESPLSDWMQTDDAAPNKCPAPTLTPEGKTIAVVEWRAPRSNGARINMYQLEIRRVHGNIDVDDSDSGLSDDDNVSDSVDASARQLISTSEGGNYVAGRWRRCGAPVPASQALAAFVKVEKERAKAAREQAVKEGRAAEFLWGSRASAMKKGDDSDSDATSSRRSPTPLTLSRYPSVDTVESPTYRRRARVNDLVNNDAISVVASSPKSAFQPSVTADNPGKCGTGMCWKVPNQTPGSRIQIRVIALNDIDWSEGSPSSDVFKLPCT